MSVLLKVPILDTLFRSRDSIRNGTKLSIIVKPYPARSTAWNEFTQPDDNFTVASDDAGIFLGCIKRAFGIMQTEKPTGCYQGGVGFIYK